MQISSVRKSFNGPEIVKGLQLNYEVRCLTQQTLKLSAWPLIISDIRMITDVRNEKPAITINHPRSGSHSIRSESGSSGTHACTMAARHLDVQIESPAWPGTCICSSPIVNFEPPACAAAHIPTCAHLSASLFGFVCRIAGQTAAVVLCAAMYGWKAAQVMWP